jgi:hypothetical protein
MNNPKITPAEFHHFQLKHYISRYMLEGDEDARRFLSQHIIRIHGFLPVMRFEVNPGGKLVICWFPGIPATT